MLNVLLWIGLFSLNSICAIVPRNPTDVKRLYTGKQRVVDVVSAMKLFDQTNVDLEATHSKFKMFKPNATISDFLDHLVDSGFGIMLQAFLKGETETQKYYRVAQIQTYSAKILKQMKSECENETDIQVFCQKNNLDYKEKALTPEGYKNIFGKTKELKKFSKNISNDHGPIRVYYSIEMVDLPKDYVDKFNLAKARYNLILGNISQRYAYC